MPAVSERNRFSPNVTAVTLKSAAAWISSGVKSPSGPMKIDMDLSLIDSLSITTLFVF
jgi:hypothetical protein